MSARCSLSGARSAPEQRRHRERPRPLAIGVVPDLSSRAQRAVPNAVLAKDQPAAALHVTRGWRARARPTCRALPGDPCRTPSGRQSSRTHQARLRRGRYELVSSESAWPDSRREDRIGSISAAAPAAVVRSTGSC